MISSGFCFWYDVVLMDKLLRILIDILYGVRNG
jgi:hypothetical protein